MAKPVIDSIIRLRLEPEPTAKLIKDTEKALTPLAQQYEKVNKATKGAQSALVGYRGQITRSQAAIANLSKLQGGQSLVLGEQNKIQQARLGIIRNLSAAQVAGGKLTAQQTQLLQGTTVAYNKTAKEIKKAGVATGGMNRMTLASIAKMAQWAVGWTFFYGIMRAVTQSIGAVIRQIGTLDNALARLQTVSFDAGESMRNLYEIAILRKATETRASIDDVAKGLYHLKTAGLDSQQALAGLEPIMGLMVGTVTNLDAAARLVATSFNVFGRQLKENRSDAEAMQYITDNLTYAYTHQQVELSEISEAMRYVGQMAGVINFDFKTLIQTIGFLGTGMLRGSRAGTSMMNALVMIASKTDILYQKLGIVFDPQKEIDFINIMRQLHDMVGDTAISVEMTARIFEVFGRRGARSILGILGRWDEWIADITIADEKLKGATKTAEEFMNKTIIGQLAVIANQLKISAYNRDIAEGVKGILSNVAGWLRKSIEMKLIAQEIKDIYEDLPDLIKSISKVDVEFATNVEEIFEDIKERIRDIERINIWREIAMATSWPPTLESQWVQQRDDMRKLGAEWGKWIKANWRELKKHPEVIEKVVDLMDRAKYAGGDFTEQIKRILDEWLKVAKKTKEIPENILAANLALEAQWQKIKRAGQYAVLQAEGYSELQIATRKENDLITDMVKRLQEVKEEHLRGIIVSKELSGAKKKEAEKRLAETMELLGSQTKLRAFLKDYIKDIQDRGPVKALEEYRKRLAILGLEGSKIFDILKAGMDAIAESTKTATQKTIDDYKKVASVITATSRDSIALAKARGASEIVAAEMARDATKDLIVEKKKEEKEFKGRADEEKRITQELNTLKLKLKSDETKVIIATENEARKELERTQDLAIIAIEHRYAREGIALKTMAATQSEVYAQEIKRHEETEKHWQSQLDSLKEVEKETGIIDKTERIRLTNLRDAATRSGEIAEANKEAAETAERKLAYDRSITVLLARAELYGETKLDQLEIEEELVKSSLRYTKEKKDELLEEIEHRKKLAEIDEERIKQEREFELTAARIAAYGGTTLEQLEAQLELAIALGDTERERALTYQIQIERLREQEQLVRNIQSTLVSGITALIKGTGDWKDLLRDVNDIFLKRALDTLIEMVFQTQLMQIIMGGLSGIFGGGGGGQPLPALGAARIQATGAAEGGVMPGGFSPIRQLAEGDIITRPTLGIVGEGKYDEAVVPLSRGRSIPVEMKGGEPQKIISVFLSVNAIDAQNTYQFLSKNKGMIASMLQSAMRENHPFRRV